MSRGRTKSWRLPVLLLGLSLALLGGAGVAIGGIAAMAATVKHGSSAPLTIGWIGQERVR